MNAYHYGGRPRVFKSLVLDGFLAPTGIEIYWQLILGICNDKRNKALPLDCIFVQ